MAVKPWIELTQENIDAIKAAIVAKGDTVTDEDSWIDLVEKILRIPQGSGQKTSFYPLKEVVEGTATEIWDNGEIEYVRPHCFENLKQLTRVQLDAIHKICNRAFYNCPRLDTLVLPGDFVRLDHKDAFKYTRIGDLKGSIYVPAELLETYKNDNVWKNFCVYVYLLYKYYYDYYGYKTKTEFEQPELTANGTVGGDSFAILPSSEHSGAYYAYCAFNNSYNDGNTTCWASSAGASESAPQYLTWYNPTKLYITNIHILNRKGTSNYCAAPKTGYIQGSNDNENWHNIVAFENSNNDWLGEWDIVMPENQKVYYYYYRIYITAGNYSSYVCINQITLTAYAVSDLELIASDVTECNDAYDYKIYKGHAESVEYRNTEEDCQTYLDKIADYYNHDGDYYMYDLPVYNYGGDTNSAINIDSLTMIGEPAIDESTGIVTYANEENYIDTNFNDHVDYLEEFKITGQVETTETEQTILKFKHGELRNSNKLIFEGNLPIYDTIEYLKYETKNDPIYCTIGDYSSSFVYYSVPYYEYTLGYKLNGLTLHGTLTNEDNIISGFSDSNYYSFDRATWFSPDSCEYEINIRFKVPETIRTSGQVQRIYHCEYLDCLEITLSTPNLQTYSYTAKENYVIYELELNTWYRVKVERTSDYMKTYTLYTDEGEELTSLSFVDTAAKYSGNTALEDFCLGRASLSTISNGYFEGEIDLANFTFTNITNDYTWAIEEDSSDYDYTVEEGGIGKEDYVSREFLYYQLVSTEAEAEHAIQLADAYKKVTCRDKIYIENTSDTLELLKQELAPFIEKGAGFTILFLSEREVIAIYDGEWYLKENSSDNFYFDSIRVFGEDETEEEDTDSYIMINGIKTYYETYQEEDEYGKLNCIKLYWKDYLSEATIYSWDGFIYELVGEEIISGEGENCYSDLSQLNSMLYKAYYEVNEEYESEKTTMTYEEMFEQIQSQELVGTVVTDKEQPTTKQSLIDATLTNLDITIQEVADPIIDYYHIYLETGTISKNPATNFTFQYVDKVFTLTFNDKSTERACEYKLEFPYIYIGGSKEINSQLYLSELKVYNPEELVWDLTTEGITSETKELVEFVDAKQSEYASLEGYDGIIYPIEYPLHVWSEG